jgi:hypothetical protein
MHKIVIGALGAVAFIGAGQTAFALDQHEEKMDDSSALESASHSLTGGSVDAGWDAVTPRDRGPRGAGEPNEIDLTFTPYFKHQDVGDLEDDAGDVEVDRVGMDLNLDYTDDTGQLWTFRWGWEESDYDIDDAPGGSAAEDALDDATVWSLSLVHRRRIDDQWEAWGGVGMQYGGADGVSFSDGRNFMGAVGGNYQVNEDLNVGLGILVKEDFDDSAEVLPIPMLTYRIDERNMVRWRGPRASFDHKVDDRITLRALLEYEMRQYRLDDDVAGAPDGAVNDSHLLLGGGVDYQVNEWFSVSGEIGVILAQEFEIEDDRGSEIDTVDGDDTGFFVGLSATFAF